MNESQVIPVHFIPFRVALNESDAIAMLGMDVGRSPLAAKRAFWEFRVQFSIQKLPGGVFSVRRIAEAADAPAVVQK